MQNKNFGWDLQQNPPVFSCWWFGSWYHNEKSEQNAWTKPTKPFPPAEGFKKILLQRADKSANMDTKGNLRKKKWKKHLTKICREIQLQKASLKYMEVCNPATGDAKLLDVVFTRHWTPKRNDGWNLTYPQVNKHSNGKSPFSIGNTSSNGGFSIAMLDYRRVQIFSIDRSLE